MASPSPPAFFQLPQLLEDAGLYPNPFADQLAVVFRLRVPATVTLAIYNVAGEPIRRIEVPAQAGTHAVPWLGVNDVGARCASGTYLIRVHAQGIDGTQGGYWARAVVAR